MASFRPSRASLAFWSSLTHSPRLDCISRVASPGQTLRKRTSAIAFVGLNDRVLRNRPPPRAEGRNRYSASRQGVPDRTERNSHICVGKTPLICLSALQRLRTWRAEPARLLLAAVDAPLSISSGGDESAPCQERRPLAERRRRPDRGSPPRPGGDNGGRGQPERAGAAAR